MSNPLAKSSKLADNERRQEDVARGTLPVTAAVPPPVTAAGLAPVTTRLQLPYDPAIMRQMEKERQGFCCPMSPLGRPDTAWDSSNPMLHLGASRLVLDGSDRLPRRARYSALPAESLQQSTTTHSPAPLIAARSTDSRSPAPSSAAQTSASRPPTPTPDAQLKYLKYKKKYLELKKILKL